jgi:hypothetical protein
MNKLFRKAAIAGAVALACGNVQAADTTISSGGVTATINDAGTFSTSTPGLMYNGVEFVAIDVPSSWFWLTVSGTDYISQYGSSSPVLGTTTSGSGFAAFTSNLPTGLGVTASWVIDAPNRLSVSVLLSNNSGSDMTGVTWGVGLDADQGGSGNNQTFNQIMGQGAGAAVRAYDNQYGTDLQVTLANNTSIGAFLAAAYINSGDCCSAVNPATALGAGQFVGYNTTADDSISLAYNIGTIGSGSSASFGYTYTFATPVPEPETYAMLLAGLGLMGFVARRRQRKLAVA